ncbi:hypothetical protein GCM10007916_11780 [Psychromonas marina]|uniref:Uncharacterized protein n=1 Tax=Psychromonas marina TaxID=88364 RepID=A0ABQ6DY72_9GAMM|nr:hypothetical protein [Psychromonas marina]GLS90111.1 hypothetical protein GCM10007916_11780 [Psychromonas marina]
MNIHPEYFIYGFGNCMGCELAKTLCDNNDKQYVFINIKEDKKAKQLLGKLSKSRGWKMGEIQIPAVYKRSLLTDGNSFTFEYIGNHQSL